MGYNYEEMLDLAGDDDEFGTNTEYLARHPIANFADSEQVDDANRKVLYIESYAKIDYDGDGIAELSRFCTAGNHHKLLHHSPVNELPFIVFNGYPEPHIWKGQSVADLLMDVQKIKSAVLRNMLDSLAKSIHPDTEVVEGQVNKDDVTSNKVGKIIRTRAPWHGEGITEGFFRQGSISDAGLSGSDQGRSHGYVESKHGFESRCTAIEYKGGCICNSSSFTGSNRVAVSHLCRKRYEATVQEDTTSFAYPPGQGADGQTPQ